MKEIVFKVEKMSCTGCENRIQNALKEMNGVEMVIADHIKKSVKIVAAIDVEIKQLKETIEDLGFEVIE